MQFLKKKSDLIFCISGFIITIFYILLFNPVYSIGDSTVYIRYAQAVADNNNTGMYLNRSPLYPFLLSLIIKTGGIESLPRVIMIIQYFLIFFSSVILFKILKQIFTQSQSFCAVLFFFFSFSTVYYGYMVLSEILTLFLFLLSTWILNTWIKLRSDYLLFITGILLSLVILARFNTLPIIASFLLIIAYVSVLTGNKISIFILSRNTLIFLLPLIIMLNLYAFYNYKTNDFYGLFPTGGSPLISRNAILASIDGTETVSDKNKPVYDIFLKAVDNYKSKERIEKKASLLKIWNPDFAKKLYAGFHIYSSASQSLCSYFGIDPENSEPNMSKELRFFYREIVVQNRSDILLMRFYSLLNSFRSSSGITFLRQENLNLGNLPAWIIITYKITIILISIFTFFAVFFYCGNSIIRWKIINPVFLSLIILYFSFYFVNLFFVIGGDSNRYKFPSEPLMFGLFVFFITKIIRLFRGKIMNFQKKQAG